MTDRLRFGLIGAGFIGGVHAANLAAHPRVDFALVHDPAADRAATLAEKHGSAVARDLESAFDPARVDAVLVASSTDTHAAYLRRAADAGLAVLCEKPIDLDLERAAAAVAHVTAAGVPAMVDFNRRFDADYVALRRAVADGEIGDVALLQLTSRGPAMPPLEYVAVSGGQLRDQTVHFFDLARWISGQDPVEVFATGSRLAEPRLAEYGDVDLSAVTMRLPSGALVQIDCSRRSGYGYDERLEVLGSHGLLEARRQQSGGVRRFRAGGVVEDGLHEGWFERARPTYAAALDHFVTAVLAGDSPRPSPADGLAAQALAEAAVRSLASGRSEPVEYR